MCVEHVGVMDTHLYQKRIRFMLYCRIFVVGVGRNWLYLIYQKRCAAYIRLQSFCCWTFTGNNYVFSCSHSQPDIAELVEVAALFCRISYLEHITSKFALRMVNIYVDQ